MQIFIFGNVLSKLVLLKGITDGGLRAGAPAAGGFRGLGAKPPATGRFFYNFLVKKAILMPLNHISQVFKAGVPIFVEHWRG